MDETQENPETPETEEPETPSDLATMIETSIAELTNTSEPNPPPDDNDESTGDMDGDPEPVNETPESDSLTPDEYDDIVLEFKADGEMRSVTLREALPLLSKGWNYDKKSSTLGQMKAQLESDAKLGAAVKGDPAGFAKAYCERNGYHIVDRQQLEHLQNIQNTNTDTDTYDADDYDGVGGDSHIKKLNERIAYLERSQQRAVEEQRLNQELSALGAKYPDMDRQQVLEVMRQRGGDAEMAYSLVALRNAQQQADKATAENTLTAKRKARNATRVHRPTSKTSAPSHGVDVDDHPGDMTLEESIWAAVNEQMVS